MNNIEKRTMLVKYARMYWLSVGYLFDFDTMLDIVDEALMHDERLTHACLLIEEIALHHCANSDSCTQVLFIGEL